MKAFTVVVMFGNIEMAEYHDIMARDAAHACDRARWKYETETGKKAKEYQYFASVQSSIFSDEVSLRVEEIYCTGGVI